MRRRSFSLLALAACVPGEKSQRGEGVTTPEQGAHDEPVGVDHDSASDPAAAGASAPSDPLSERVAALEAEYGRRGFSVIEQAPWVVLGDEKRAVVQRRATDTIAWATDRLGAAYFGRPPKQIVEVWLFKDKRSYMRNAKAIFDDEPDTPYGYYSFDHEALIMNIASGGGTLVHEMVHPLMRANFPACPSWFNEGLASLYEQCGEEAGHIVGYTNWRLPGLQEAIAAGTVPSFETLLATSEDGFYSEDPGTNYAQARYLCYWLQEQGRLQSFYRDFVDAADRDPTGIATLRAHAGTDDLGAFQRKWQRYVSNLSYA